MKYLLLYPLAADTLREDFAKQTTGTVTTQAKQPSISPEVQYIGYISVWALSTFVS